MRIISLMATASALALAATPILAQTGKSQTGQTQSTQTPTKEKAKKDSQSTQTFVTKAAHGGMFEVQSSEIAVERTKREDVKPIAQKMIQDHGKANEDLKRVAGEVGATLPARLDNKHQSLIDKLRSAGAQSFDRTYIDAQMQAHKEAVSLFGNYARSGDNAELKKLAADTLPVLQEHERSVEALHNASSAATGKSSGSSGKSK